LLTGDFYDPPPFGNSSKVKTEGHGSGSERKPDPRAPQIDWNIFKFHRIPGGKSINNAFEVCFCSMRFCSSHAFSLEHCRSIYLLLTS
jgi:hypothetical protein